MESGVIAVIVLFILIGGTIALAIRQRIAPWSLPSLRISGSPGMTLAERETDPDRSATLADDGPLELSPRVPAPAARLARVSSAPARGRGAAQPAPELLRLDVPSTISPALAARLERIEHQIDELRHLVDRQAGESRGDAERLASALAARVDADVARREGALDRLRADLLLAVSGAAAERQAGATSRRAEVAAELYARLARFEAALAAVTNPILLPGEAYTAPGELLAEALLWENWHDVGERVFALADTFGAQRIHLTMTTSAELGEFITTLRLLLTRAVYPNLHDDADAAQRAALQGALAEIAAALPTVRESLDREYRGEQGS